MSWQCFPGGKTIFCCVSLLPLLGTTGKSCSYLLRSEWMKENTGGYNITLLNKVHNYPLCSTQWQVP